jgi:hypothetical protein
MKTLMANEVAFVSGGSDWADGIKDITPGGTVGDVLGTSGSTGAGGYGGCTTTCPNGPTTTLTVGISTSGPAAGVSVAFPACTTTCPTPAPTPPAPTGPDNYTFQYL